MMLALLILVSIAGAAPFAYITSSLNNTVSIIDTATNTITATITGFSSPCGIAITPDGTKVYVANRLGGTVSVIDTTTNKVIATFTVG